MPKKFNMKDLLNDTSKAETSDPSGFDIRNIPYNKIKPSKANFYSLQGIGELAASIDELGLMHNLVVVEADEAGFYKLTSGERRYKALGLLKWATVPCKVEGRATSALEELRLIHANATARVLSDAEKVKQAVRLKALLLQLEAEGHKFKTSGNSGRMRDVVAEYLDISPTQMQRYEEIDKNLSHGWEAEFEAGNIGISAAYEISKATPEEQAAGLAEYKESGQPPASKPKQPDPPKPKPEAVKEPPASPSANFEKVGEGMAAGFAAALAEDDPEDDDPKRAYVFLTDTDGGQYEASGSLAVIAAIDGEDFGGYISEGDAAQIDYIMLATALVGEFMRRMGDDIEGKKALQTNLAALFDNGGGGGEKH